MGAHARVDPMISCVAIFLSVVFLSCGCGRTQASRRSGSQSTKPHHQQSANRHHTKQVDRSCDNAGDCTVFAKPYFTDEGCCFSCDPIYLRVHSLDPMIRHCQERAAPDCPQKKCGTPKLADCIAGQCQAPDWKIQPLQAKLEWVKPVGTRIVGHEKDIELKLTLINRGEKTIAISKGLQSHPMQSLVVYDYKDQHMPTIPPPAPHTSDLKKQRLAPHASIEINLGIAMFSPSLSSGTYTMRHRLYPSEAINFTIR